MAHLKKSAGTVTGRTLDTPTIETERRAIMEVYDLNHPPKF